MGELVRRADGGLVPDDIISPVTVDLPKARGLVVGPDDVLVVVFPPLRQDELAAHRKELHRILGDRFVFVAGDGVQLAKVRREDWADNAVDHR